MIEFDKIHLAEAGRKIVEDNPLIYTEMDTQIETILGAAVAAKMQQDGSYVNLRYGFEFGAGWLPIAADLSEQLSTLIELVRGQPACGLPSATSPQEYYIHGFIFKEKFGSMVWQGNHHLPKEIYPIFRAVLDHYERKASFTCEVTGASNTALCLPNDGTGHGWRRTLCKEACLQLNYIPEKTDIAQRWGIDRVTLNATAEHHEKNANV